MSGGFEVVGLVLAIFPVVVEVVEWYRGMVKGRDTRCLSNTLETYNKIFLDSVELLLRCAVRDDQLRLLLSDPRGEAWTEPSFTDKLAEHLGTEADSILEKIGVIYRTVLKLQNKLPTRESVDNNQNRLARAKIIIKIFVQGPHHKASLERLKLNINEFRTLTSNALILAPLRGGLPKDLQDLNLVQESAGGLYDALQNGWQCECDDPHPAHIKLEVWSLRTEDGAEEGTGGARLKFSFLFADDAERAHSDHWFTAEITSGTAAAGGSDQGNMADVIIDMCTTLKNPAERPPAVHHGRLRSMSDANGRSYNLFSKPYQIHSVETRQSITLADKLFNPQTKLKKKARVHLALKLAWAVLQISSTSWLSGRWTKKDILLVVDDPNHPLPYVSHGFQSSYRVSPSTTPGPNTNDPIADWIRHDSLFALGIIMLEMCYDRSIEDLASEKEKGDDGEPWAHTPFLTATRTAKLVQEEMGMQYANAVNACLYPPAVDMDAEGRLTDPSQLARSIWKNIIEPLKACAEYHGVTVV